VLSSFGTPSLIWQYSRQLPAFAMSESLNLLVVSDANPSANIQEHEGDDEGEKHPRMLHGVLNHERHLGYFVAIRAMNH
jgi:hypothetical protein